MTRKEKIIEILKSNIHLSFIEDELTGSDHPAMTHKYHSELNGFEQSADAILSLPIEVPSEEELNKWVNEDKKRLFDDEVWTAAELKERLIGRFEGAKWAINEIIERNKK